MTPPPPSARPSDPARGIARTVLYEGYVLWPYRRSAPKNQRRWTFGGVHPRAWSEDGHPDDAWRMRTECLVEAAGDAPAVAVTVRFLQVVERRVARVCDGRLDFVDAIEVDGERWARWDEACEREIPLPALELGTGAEVSAPIAIHAASEREWIRDAEGNAAGAVVRSWRSVDGRVTARAEPLRGGAFCVAVEVSNTTAWEGDGREDALRSSFASTHVVLRGRDAVFASLTDPPAPLEEAAAGCRNEGCWPVLVGLPGSRDTMLASPIILPDHPAIAPESPGDFFDGGEIDEMLTLHVLALTDEEKEEMRATDPRTREILDRTTALAPERIMGLHGTFRDGATGRPAPENLAGNAPDPFWVELGEAPAQELVVDGVTLRPGSRVRLRPGVGGDVMDIVLAGRVALIEGIDEDQAGGVHLSVVIEGDPGRDLGLDRIPGHRFWFRPEEVEPLPPRRILVAGIGNVFFGDDGFGVEVARRLSGRTLPEGVTVRDFGIRGLDLAYALQDYEAVVFVDAAPRGGEPGTLYVIEADTGAAGPVGVDTHGMDPASVLAFARALGPLPDVVRVVGCEPEVIPDPAADEIVGELSGTVLSAVERAVTLVESLVDDLQGRKPGVRSPD